MGSLTGSNNAILFNDCASLRNLKVTLTLTHDLITWGNYGFALQLNCYPQPKQLYQDYPLEWFQHVIQVVNNSFEWGIQYWSEKRSFGYSPKPNYVWFGSAPSNQVQARSTLEIELATDPNGNVSYSNFQVTDPKGTAIAHYGFPFPSNVWFAIYGFQVDLVGPGSGTHSCVFTSGGGNLTYSVTSGKLVVQNRSCGGSQLPTGETSNAVYGNVEPASGGR